MESADELSNGTSTYCKDDSHLLVSGAEGTDLRRKRIVGREQM